LDAAMVLLLVSLLLAGMLKADSLVLDGRTKQLKRDIEAHRFAYLTYTDRYRAIPGDDDGAGQRWPGAKAGNGDGRMSGTYRDSVASPSQLQVGADSGETINYWWHLRLAGLINGGETITDLPTNPFGGLSGVQETGYGMRGLVLCYENVPAAVAAAVDRQIDDGRANQGALRGSADASTVPRRDYDLSAGDYLECVSLSGSGTGAVAPLIKGRGRGNAHGANSNASPNASDGSANGQNGNM
jgi:hypothetical protein